MKPEESIFEFDRGDNTLKVFLYGEIVEESVTNADLVIERPDKKTKESSKFTGTINEFSAFVTELNKNLTQ